MDVPLELSFEHLDKSDALESRVRDRVSELDRIYDHLIACRVSVKMPHKHSRTGNQPAVRIEMSVPGEDIVISGEPHRFEEKYRDPTVYDAVEEAFDVAERRLKQFKAKQREEVQPDPVPLVGRVVDLRPEQDHGFLITAAGSQLWFHRNSVLENGFDALSAGDTVHYLETVGETGPQAIHVKPAGVVGRSL